MKLNDGALNGKQRRPFYQTILGALNLTDNLSNFIKQDGFAKL
jgi:hypothetical protein